MTRPIVRITIPDCIPPSVNHYKKPVKRWINGEMRESYVLTEEAEAFLWQVQIAARGATVIPAGATKHQLNQIRYSLHVRVVFGPKQRGDGDNFWKCIADSLQKVGVIHSDARVKRWYIEVEDGERATGPRTEIRVAVMRSQACLKHQPSKNRKPRMLQASSPAPTQSAAL